MNKKTIYVICVVVTLLAVIGIIRFSFAFFELPVIGAGTNNSLTSEKLMLSFFDSVSSITKYNIFPGDSFEKELKITNTSRKNSVTYDLVWESINNTFINNEIHISATCNSYINYGTQTQELEGTCKGIDEKPTGSSTSIPVISGIVIQKGYTHVYSVKIEFIETGEPQEYNKGKIFNAVLGVQGKGQIVATNNCDANDTDIKCTIVNDNSVVVDSGIDFASVSSDSNGKGLYYTNDLTKNENDSGIYYYRGAVDNNYLLFAGYCWRIVRTNEDGSIKIRYSGTPTNGACPQTGTNVSISTSPYHNNASDAADIGFTHGNKNNFPPNSVTGIFNFRTEDNFTFGSNYTFTNNTYTITGTQVTGQWNTDTICTSTSCPVANYYSCLDYPGATTCDMLYQITGYHNSSYASILLSGKMSSSYAMAHGTGENSNIKNILDTWYTNNIASKGTNITNKIADTPYCNDRSLFSGNGYGVDDSYFYGYHRIMVAKSPQLKCNNATDKYTVSNLNGNGGLTNPVAVLTADEVAYAGGVAGYNNQSYYLYTGSDYWTLTPSDFTYYRTYILFVRENGSIQTNGRGVQSKGIIPVISLKADTTISSGEGLYNNPYVVE